jgi:chitin-binding protein
MGGAGATSGSGGSAGSGGEGPDTTPPEAPSDLTLESATDTTLELSWTGASDNVGVTAYKLYRAASLVGTGSETSFVFKDLAPNTSYVLGVRAVDAANNHSALATFEGKTKTAPDTGAPSRPSGLMLGAITTTSLALSWNASTDDVGVVGYKLFEGPTLITTVAGTSHTFTPLEPDTTFTLGVSAYDAAGNESSRATLDGTTLAEGNCGAPAWVSGQDVQFGEYRTAICAASPQAGTECQGFAGKKRAFQCLDGNWCDSINPNGSTNDSGIWVADPGDC